MRRRRLEWGWKTGYHLHRHGDNQPEVVRESWPRQTLTALALRSRERRRTVGNVGLVDFTLRLFFELSLNSLSGLVILKQIDHRRRKRFCCVDHSLVPDRPPSASDYRPRMPRRVLRRSCHRQMKRGDDPAYIANVRRTALGILLRWLERLNRAVQSFGRNASRALNCLREFLLLSRVFDLPEPGHVGVNQFSSGNIGKHFVVAALDRQF